MSNAGNALYTEEYRTQCYFKWWNSGKPSAGKLMLMLPSDINGKVPGQATLQGWIRDWKEQSDELDERVKRELSEVAVQKKVELYRKFAEIGKQMEEIGLTWILQHKEKLTAGTALRLLVEGINVQRSAVGVPEAIEKMMNMSDEDVIGAIAEIIGDSELLELTSANEE